MSAFWGARAHEHDLSLESAEAGIAIAEWFAAQQLAMLARGRQESRRKLEDRVIELIEERQARQQGDYITARIVQNRHITRTAEEAQALLNQMVADGILTVEEIRRPEGGHVERRYRLKGGANPVSA